MNRYTFTKLKSFRILFESIKDQGKVGWTVIEDCTDYEDAINYFRERFSFVDYEIIQIREVSD
jgi:glutaredoxin-related protein